MGFYALCPCVAVVDSLRLVTIVTDLLDQESSLSSRRLIPKYTILFKDSLLINFIHLYSITKLLTYLMPTNNIDHLMAVILLCYSYQPLSYCHLCSNLAHLISQYWVTSAGRGHSAASPRLFLLTLWMSVASVSAYCDRAGLFYLSD